MIGWMQALQKMCKRQRDERDSALDAEHRALMRAAAIETDRDKIQRQFKVCSMCFADMRSAALVQKLSDADLSEVFA